MAPQKPSRRKRSSSPKHRKHAAKRGGRPERSREHARPFLTSALPLLLLVLLTFIAYANAWPDNLVWDDARFAVSERYSELGLTDIGRFFTEDLWAVEGYRSGLYRPLLLLSVMLDVRLLGDWVAGYHLVNILLHVLATVLVFGFTRYLLLARGGPTNLSHYAALLAALIFGVHPIHTEVVNSIFNRSEVLASIGVIGGLWWFLKIRELRPGKAWFGLSVIYLLALFCRESSVVLPALVVAMLLFTLPGDKLLRLRKCIPIFFLLIPLGLYLFMRNAALELPARVIPQQVPAAGHLSGPQTLQKQSSEVISDPAEPASRPRPGKNRQTGPINGHSARLPRLAREIRSFRMRRLPNAARLWAASLKALLWPHPLQLYRGRATFSDLWTSLALQLALLAAALAGYHFKRPGLGIGLSFFYIAMLPSSGFLATGGPIQLAERFLYLPSVGLAIVLAFALSWLAQRGNLLAAILPVAILTALFMPLTWARNSEWANEVSLVEADYTKGVRNEFVLQSLITQYMDTKNHRRAAEICDSSPILRLRNRNINNLCGRAYELAGRVTDAEETLLHFVVRKQANSMIHFTLASLYLRHGRRSEAQEQYERGIAAERKAPHREFLSGFMLTELYPRDRIKLLEARAHFEKALELQPQFFQARQTLNELDQKLNPNRH